MDLYFFGVANSSLSKPGLFDFGTTDPRNRPPGLGTFVFVHIYSLYIIYVAEVDICDILSVICVFNIHQYSFQYI